jgi:hypothetical protein
MERGALKMNLVYFCISSCGFFYHLDGNSGASFKISKNNTVGTFPTIFVPKKKNSGARGML